MSERDNSVNTGARPKRSSLKNWPPPTEVAAAMSDVETTMTTVMTSTLASRGLMTSSCRFPKKRMTNFHQQSLDDALEMRNLTLEEEKEYAQVRSP